MAKPPGHQKRPAVERAKKAISERQKASLKKAHATLPGNNWWRKRSRHGIKPIFPPGEEGAAMLRECCEDFFTHCDENPLLEDRSLVVDKELIHDPVARLRAYTLGGLCIFIDITRDTWYKWKDSRHDLRDVMEWAEETIRDQKFIGASAGLLNATIISRDLGLAEKNEVSGPGGGPIPSTTSNLTPKEAADLYAKAREGK